MTSARIQLPDHLHLSEETFPENDPFLSDQEVYEGPTPPDLVERFDDYLYGSED